MRVGIDAKVNLKESSCAIDACRDDKEFRRRPSYTDNRNLVAQPQLCYDSYASLELDISLYLIHKLLGTSEILCDDGKRPKGRYLNRAPRKCQSNPRDVT